MKKQRWRARDYVVIPRSLLTQKISPSALRLWIALASYCYDSDSCFPSNRAIMERMPPGTALNTVKSAKRELEEQGLIRRERRFDKGRETSSVYILLYLRGLNYWRVTIRLPLVITRRLPPRVMATLPH